MAVEMSTVIALAGAGIAIGVAGIGTMIGLSQAGISGAGAVSENKDNFRSALVLQALPQTQTIYGFITALFIIMGAGLLGGGDAPTMAEGYSMLAAGVIVGITGLSAIFQGKVAAAGIAATAKDEGAFVPSIVFAGQVETPAIFGFIISLMVLVVGLGVL